MNSAGAPGSLLQATGVTAILAGAAGSVVLLFRASHRRPPLLMAIFVIWVLAPFLGLLLADARSKHWPVRVRTTLYIMMLVTALASLTVYADDALHPRRAQAAFVYVAMPPASCLLSAAALAIAALRRHTRSAR